MTTTGANRRRISILLGGLLVAIAPGCAEMPHWTPFHGPSSDRVDGVVAPYERVAELRALAAGAGKHGPEEKEKIAKQLAQSIGKEQDPLIRAEIIGALASFPGPTADAILKTGKVTSDRVFVLEPNLKSKAGESDPAEKAKMSRVDFSLK